MPYLANQLPLLVHTDVETCGRSLDAHTAPKGVRLHNELGWGEQWEERERKVRGALAWDKHGDGDPSKARHWAVWAHTEQGGSWAR